MSSSSFPHVLLGEVVSHNNEFITIEDDKKYKRCRVQLHAKGIILRDKVFGAEIKTKKQQVCKARELLVAEIDAKVGGFGIVPAELEGAIVSSHYFLYEINEAKILPEFLGWFVRTPFFRDQVSAQGSTNYASIRPHNVLGYKIPLPSLAEQLQIVRRIESIATKLEDAKQLRKEIDSKTKAIGASILFGDGAKEYERVLLKNLLSLRSPDIEVRPSDSYSFAGVYSFGRGLFKSGVKSGQDTAYKRLTKLKTGNFTYPKLMAWEGALGVVPPELDGCVVSPEFPVFELDQTRILPEVIDIYFRSASIWPEVATMSKGTNVRRRRVHPTVFLEYKFPLPPMHIQKQLRAIRKNAEKLSSERVKIDSKLDALLPSILDKAFRGELNIAQTEHRPAKVVSIEKKNTASEAFQEAVLIARLVREFTSDGYLLSRKRYTKLAYLFHRKSKDDVKRRYLKKAAGPYSPWTKYQGPEKIALTNKYIQKGKTGKYSGFQPGQEIDQIDNYFATYWDEDNIGWLIERFKYKSTDILEVLATVDMAILDLVEQGRVVSLDTVKEVIASEPEWFPKLSRKIFSDDAIAGAIRELQGWFITD